MDITLTDKDIDIVAQKVAKLLDDRLMRIIAQTSSFDAAKKYGESLADMYIRARVPEHEAKDMILRELSKNGLDKLRQIVHSVVSQVLDGDEQLRKMVCKEVYEYSIKAADEVRRRLSDEES